MAHRLQKYAARTPMLTSVSIVAAAWRALTAAARWKGQAPQATITVVRAKATHCHPGNCRMGNIEIATTGSASTSEMTNRVRRESTSPSSLPPSLTGAAAYPVCSTTLTSSATEISESRSMCALSVA